MNLYSQLIMKATGCAEADIPDVEEIMRDLIFHSTLDWQSRAQFNRGAREAYAFLPEYRRLKSELKRT